MIVESEDHPKEIESEHPERSTRVSRTNVENRFSRVRSLFAGCHKMPDQQISAFFDDFAWSAT